MIVIYDNNVADWGSAMMAYTYGKHYLISEFY